MVQLLEGPAHVKLRRGCGRAQEWLRGGHLLDKLEEMSGQHYTEQQASILFTQVRPENGKNDSCTRHALACFARLEHLPCESSLPWYTTACRMCVE